MLKTRIVQPSTFQWLVNENLGRWKVVSRKTPGQDYCWVVINGDEPKIGPAPFEVSDWCTTADHWSRSRPYRAYIPITPKNNNFPACGWVSHWGFNNSSHFPTEEALAKKVAEAQHHILDQYRFIAFNIKRDPTWRTCAALSTLKDMIVNAGLTECAYRGCIVDLKTADLLDMIMLIEDNIPLHYQWFPADVGPFNPRGLNASAYDLGKETTKEQHYTIDFTGGVKVAISRREFRHWAYWCTTMHQKSPLGDEYLLFQDVQHAGDDFTLIDMEDIQHSDPSPDGPAVVDVDKSSDYSSDDKGESMEVKTQEMPLLGVTLGITTTALSQSKLDAADNFLSTLKGVMTVTMQQEPHDRVLQQKDITITSCSPVASQIREDVSAPCLPLPIVPCAMQMSDTEIESPPRDERGMLQESGSSRKRTISTIGSLSKTRENKWHCAIISENQQLTPPERLPSESSASLDVVISPLSAIEQPTLLNRVHGVATVSPTPVPQVLSQLATELKFSRPSVVLPGINFPIIATQRMGKLVTTFRTAYNHDPNYWNNYKKNVKNCSVDPLQFSPADLVEHALAGPSLDATDWASGDISDGLYADMVTPADKGILVGRSLQGSESCWPPYELWDASTGWTGCWSDDNESWFQSHLSNLSDGRLDTPKSCQVWRKLFKPAPAVVSQDPAHCGTDLFAHYHEPCWDLAQYEAA
ncbi:hypothetical protein EV424DRAFT_1343969 [Suillus variegatus]|nr:hypothetical protein EV424DRAFT_1343969 [Suillus variegatus]